jgi:hypothetical protein
MRIVLGIFNFLELRQSLPLEDFGQARKLIFHVVFRKIVRNGSILDRRPNPRDSLGIWTYWRNRRSFDQHTCGIRRDRGAVQNF